MPATAVRRKTAAAAVLVLAVFFVNLHATTVNVPLGRMGGMAEEYVDMGRRLAQTGRFYEDQGVPAVFRPPGYVLFVAGVLKATGVPAAAEAPPRSTAFFRPLFVAQSALMSLAALALFWMLAARLRATVAFVFSLIFGTDPYAAILPGLLHYESLHLFLVLCGTCALYFAHRRKSPAGLLGAGAVWGLATLTRPMSLILPVFVALAFVSGFRRARQRHIRCVVAFALGMALVIAPWTLRNHSLTGRLIPVNAQGNIVLWASTQKKLEPAPNHFRWWHSWYDGGEQIYKKVTGATAYDYTTFVRNIVRLDDEFKVLARENLRTRPGVYLHNVFENFLSYNSQINSVFLKFYQAAQNPALTPRYKEWLVLGNPQDFIPGTAAAVFSSLVALLGVLGLAGLLAAWRSRDSFLAVPFLVHLSFAAAHSVSYLDVMYYYVKWPFLVIFAAYLVDRVWDLGAGVHRLPVRIFAGPVLAGLLCVMSFWLTARVIYGL